MINYFYKIENKINGKFYYGVHKTNDLENDYYMGSGKRIKYAIKKYGIKNFQKQIIFKFDTFKDALEYEAEFVNEQLLLDPSCYNLKIGGFGGWDYINNNEEIKIKKGKSISKKLKFLYAEGILKSKGWNTKNNKKGRIFSQHTKDLISLNNGNKLSKEILKERLNDLKTIERKRGWIGILSKKWNISGTQVRRFIEKNRDVGP